MRKGLKILCVFSLLSFYSCSTTSPSNFNGSPHDSRLKCVGVSRVNDKDYPRVVLSCEGVDAGKPIDVSNAASQGKLQILEDDIPCKILFAESIIDSGSIEALFLTEANALSDKHVRKEFFIALNSLKNLPTSALKVRVVLFAGDTALIGEIGQLAETSASFVPESTNVTTVMVRYLDSLQTVAPAENRAIFFVLHSENAADSNRFKASLVKHPSGTAVQTRVMTSIPVSEGSLALTGCEMNTMIGNEDDDILNAVGRTIQLARKSHLIVEVEVPNNESLLAIRTYNLRYITKGMHGHNDTLSSELTHEYSRAMLQAVVANLSMSRADSLCSRRLFNDALDELHKTYDLIPDTAIVSRARDILLDYGKRIKQDSSYQDIPLLTAQAEEKWGFDPDVDPWYRDAKLQLLDAFLGHLPSVDSTLDKRMLLLENLLALDPRNNRYISGLFQLKGDWYSIRNENWPAAFFYDSSYQRKASAEVDTKLKQSVLKAIARNNQTKQFDSLYRGAKPYQLRKWFAGSFEYRCMFFRSCLAMHDDNLATSHLEWMLYNWEKNQSLLSWESALQQLQELYSRTLRFTEAFRLNQRLFRQEKNPATIIYALNNLRIKYLFSPFAILPSVFGRLKSDEHRRELFDSCVISFRPAYLVAFYILSPDWSVLYSKMFERRNEFPLKQKTIAGGRFPAVVYDVDRNRAWLVNLVEGGYLVAELNLAPDEKEKVMLDEIQQEPMKEQPWSMLVEYELSAGVRTSTELISTMMGVEMCAGEHLDISTYWKFLKSQEIYSYLVFHGRDGKPEQIADFDRSKSSMESQIWDRSSRTSAFFLQAIQYGGVPTLDLAQPIYAEKNWKGVIRFGIVKE